jgi:hypothetical protein
VLVAQTCNPSHSGIRRIVVQSQANISRDPISKNPLQNRAAKVAQGVGPKFKPQYHKKRQGMLVHTYVSVPIELRIT